MDPPKGHTRSAASTHVNHERSFHHDRPDHETDLDAIGEKGDEAHPTLTRHMSFDSCGGDSNFTSLSDIIDGLPTAVKSSLGPLRTIRRSASIRSWVSYFYEISTNSMGAHISHEEEHRRTLVSTTTTEVEMQQEQHQQAMNSNQKRRRTSNTLSMRNPKDHPPSGELVEYVEPERKGIDRFCGMQGQLLVNNALSERRSSHNQPAGADYSNERRAYIQGLTWLLQGLPHDLDDHERTDLRRALPATLLGDRDPPHHARRLNSSLHPGGGGRATDRSFIQRVVAALIVQLVAPVQFFWAYFVVLLGYAVYLERKYKVAEVVVKCSGAMGYSVGVNGVRCVGVVYQHGGARVGAVITEAVAYVCDGVLKGVSDGIREACLELKEGEGDGES